MDQESAKQKELQEQSQEGAEARFILLTDPEHTLLAPLMQKLLLPPSEMTEKLWKKDRWTLSTLREVL